MFDYTYRTVELPDGSKVEGMMTSEEARNLAQGGSVTGYGTYTAAKGGGLLGFGQPTQETSYRNGQQVKGKGLLW